MRRSCLAIAAIAAVVGLAPSMAPAAPPTPVVVFQNTFEQWQAGKVPTEVLQAVAEAVAEKLPAAERKAQSERIRRLFRDALRLGDKRFSLFAAAGREHRTALVGLLRILQHPLSSGDVVEWLPAAGTLPQFDWEAAQSSEFLPLAASLWDAPCTQRVLDLLDAKEVSEKPEWFLAAAFLGLNVTGDAQRPEVAARVGRWIAAAEKVDEPGVVERYRIVHRSRWKGDKTPAGKAVREAAELVNARLARLLADDVDLLERHNQPRLTDDEFFELAALVADWSDWLRRSGEQNRVAGWDGWGVRLGRQLKDPKRRNGRVRRLLAGVLERSGPLSYRLFDQRGEKSDLGLVSRDADVELFVYLHGEAEEPGRPWDVLTRVQGNRPASRTNRDLSQDLVRNLLAPRHAAQWSAEFMSLIRISYFDADRDRLVALFRALVQDPRVPGSNPLRKRLLQMVYDDGFSDRWSDGWNVALDAAAGTTLLGEVPLDAATVTALDLMTTVCVAQPMPAPGESVISGIRSTYGLLLQRVNAGLQRRGGPNEPPLTLEQALPELDRIFEGLARYDQARQLDGLNEFFQEVQKSFKAAVKEGTSEGTDRATKALRLLFRVAAVLRQPDKVKDLAVLVGRDLFGVNAESGFRVVGREEAKRYSAMLEVLAPAVESSIRSVQGNRAATESSIAGALPRYFLDHVYLPLMRTTYLLDEVDSGSAAPWLGLLDLMGSQRSRSEVLSKYIDELRTQPYLSCPAATRVLLRKWIQAHWAESRVWENPNSREHLPPGNNITIPILKELWDEHHTQLKRLSARPDLVVDTVLDVLRDDLAWAQEVVYERGRVRATVVADRREYLGWLEGVLTFFEAENGPFCDERDQRFEVERNFEYSPEQGPRFVLPDTQRWKRSKIPGSRRLRLYQGFHALSTKEPFEFRLRVAELLLLLPNREDHLTKIGLGNGWLPKFNSEKKKAVEEWETLLDGGGLTPEQEFEALRFLVRLRFSFHPPVLEAAGSASARARARLIQDARRRLHWRALVREQTILEMVHGAKRRVGGTELEARVSALLEMAEQESSELRGIGQVVESSHDQRMLHLQLRANYARQFFELVDGADVALLYPILKELENPDTSPELALRILCAQALVLPYYGVEPADFFKRFDDPNAAGRADPVYERLLLFSLLSGKAKEMLAGRLSDEAAFKEPRDRALMRQLLLQHNAVGVLLAGRVFQDHDLLRRVQENREVEFRALNFHILYDHIEKVEVSARDLLDSAVKSAETTFRIYRESPAGPSDDEALAFLAPALSPAPRDTAVQTTVPLDDLLRTMATIVVDSRYENHPDETVRKAAGAFQESARGFIESPPELAWFSGGNGAKFAAAESWFRALDAIAEAVAARPWPEWDQPAGWVPHARRKHEELWIRLVFGPKDGPPPWQASFVARFAGQAGENLPQALRNQRRQALLLLAGDDVARKHPLRGIKANLQSLRTAGARGSAFRERCWEVTRSIVPAALTGTGLSDADAVFAAKPFVGIRAGAAQSVRAVQEEDFQRCLAVHQSDLLFEAIDFLNAWREASGEFEEKVDGLLGPTFEALAGRDRVGLGAGRFASAGVSPLGYRHALWASFSRYVAENIGPRFGALKSISDGIADQSDLASQVLEAQRSSVGACESLSQAITFRVRHNQRIECLAGRSRSSTDDPVRAAARERVWRFLRIDSETLRWLVRGSGAEGLGRLAPIWAPYERYAFGPAQVEFQTIHEAAELGIATAAFTAADADDAEAAYAFLYLLTHLQFRGNEPELTPLHRRQFEVGLQALRIEDGAWLGAAGQREPPRPIQTRKDVEGCVDACREWTSADAWRRLSRSRSFLPEAEISDDYRFHAVSSEDAARERELSPLAKRVLGCVHWNECRLEEWPARYSRKMEVVRAADRLVQEGSDVRSAGGLAAEAGLDAFGATATGLFPWASPFQPDVRSGRIEFYRLSDDSKQRLESLRGEFAGDSSERSKNRWLNSLLLQWHTSPGGTARICEHGHAELIDAWRAAKRRE